jgi:hypothetical protein
MSMLGCALLPLLFMPLTSVCTAPKSQQATLATAIPNGKTKLDLGSFTNRQLTLLTSPSFSTFAIQPTPL